MKLGLFKLFQHIIDKLKQERQHNDDIKNDITIINMNRLFYSSLVAIPVHLTHILIFVFTVSASTEYEIKWRFGIIISHLILMSLMCTFAITSYSFRKREVPNRFMFFLQYAVVGVLAAAGAIITALDQFVTASITPFLVVNVIIGVMFLIRPLMAVIFYLSGFALFSYLLGLTQLNQVILASNRVNGLTSVAIGVCLCIILWRANTVNILQRRVIIKQNNDLETKNLELQFLASYDNLTGLVNRRHFEELFRKEILMMRRFKYDSCIVIMDIDYFKKVNDQYGHPAGDAVLEQISNILIKNLREIDLIARWGGEEFIMLFAQTSAENGVLIAEKLRCIIENTVFEIGDCKIKITASLGVAAIDHCPDYWVSFHHTYAEADRALYLAKHNGRNQVQLMESTPK